MSPTTQSPLAADSRSGSLDIAAGRSGGFSGLLWLTWRQHRWALIGALVLAAALTGWMAYLAADLTDIYHQCNNTLCPDNSVQAAELSANFGSFRIANDLLQFVEYLPLLIGMFLGVPLLAREHEQRTLLLAWSQDVSPQRWLWTKLALLGTVVAALTAALSGVCDHLAQVMADVSNGGLFEGSMFMDSGMLPLATGVSWFAVGVALGAAAKRLMPAAMTVIVGYVGADLLTQWRYPTLITPVSRFVPFPPPPGTGPGVNALKVKGGIQIGPDQVVNLFDSAGHPVDYAALSSHCPNFGLGPDTLTSCLTRDHYQTFLEYQPADRIPEFHLILAAGHLTLGAVALLALWLTVRRTPLTAG
ncbi:ABC transporter permease [Streptacidiphilus carbonis]|jgi:hypothetical protein|uniref:ABC transporter permease n=1 Tax=Streptacidiphilus carbonis TaxID=105422 RepID=UPI000AC4E58C|nr:ABC transporter permease [Streptacidiphilus carbonis]